jgi:hypothetical protein
LLRGLIKNSERRQPNRSKPLFGSQFAFERPIEDCREQHIEFSGGLRLEALQGIYFGTQIIETGYYSALFRENRYGYSEALDPPDAQIE